MKKASVDLIFNVFKLIIVVLVISFLVFKFLAFFKPKPGIAFEELSNWLANRVIDCNKLYNIILSVEKNNERICYDTSNAKLVYFYVLPINLQCSSNNIKRGRLVLYAEKNLGLETSEGVFLPFDSLNGVGNLESIFDQYCKRDVFGCIDIRFSTEDHQDVSQIYWGDNLYVKIIENNCQGEVGSIVLTLPSDRLIFFKNNKKSLQFSTIAEVKGKRLQIFYNDYLGLITIKVSYIYNKKRKSFEKGVFVLNPIKSGEFSIVEDVFGKSGKIVLEIEQLDDIRKKNIILKFRGGAPLKVTVTPEIGEEYVFTVDVYQECSITDYKIEAPAKADLLEKREPILLYIQQKGGQSSTNGKYLEIRDYKVKYEKTLGQQVVEILGKVEKVVNNHLIAAVDFVVKGAQTIANIVSGFLSSINPFK